MVAKNSKSHIWTEKLKEIEKLADGLGRPIDLKVRDVVVGLNLFKVTTTQSCHGHLDHGYAYPWIEISSNQTGKTYSKYNNLKDLQIQADKQQGQPDPKLMKEIFSTRNEIEKDVASSLTKPIKLLSSFYKKHPNTSFNKRLILNNQFITSRIQPQGGVTQALNNEKTKKLNLKTYQEELQKFGQYLKTIFHDNLVV